MMRRTVPFLTGLTGNGIIGLRREDKNVWERRVPLTPNHVKKLLTRGTVKKVIVQPSTIRAFDDRAYEEVGAEINEDLAEASTICAVKEVPAQLLIPERTYMFFSHTIKAQAYNMPLLDTILDKKVRLLDYERIVNNDGRMVKFGPYAGFAGMIDTLHALGLALLTRGFATPFLHISMSKEYSSLEVARSDLREVGEQIRKRGLPKEICPLTIAITGAGSVSNAAQQILHLLPCKYVEVDDLPKLWKRENKDTHHIHVVVVRAKDMVVPKDSSAKFSQKEYYANPDNFRPVFHETVAPYVKVLMNGMYWEPRFPRLLTIEQARTLEKEGRFPLLCLGDITCDVGGSVEFFVKATTIQNPFYVYDIKTGDVKEMHQFTGNGVIIDGVDHIPAEFPKEASTDFGDGLLPLVEKVAVSDGAAALEVQEAQLGPELFGSIVTNKGQLTPKFEYISRMRAENEAESQRKKIVVFGGGMTSGPCVRYLLSNPQNQVTLVDSSQSNLDYVMNNFGKPLGLEDAAGGLRTVRANASKIDSFLSSLIKASDVVVSLLPATMHPTIAECAVKHHVPMVTASYVSPQMEALRPAAEAKKSLVVNEIGLDPGIDIMTSAKIIDEIHREGGVVTDYISLCGALPQPEHSDGPMGYKFSWSPRGVLTAATRPTRFFANGEWFEIPGHQLYYCIQPLPGFKGLDLHWIPNGNSERYAEAYKLTSGLQTCIRGTLRYEAFAPVIRAFLPLGLLNAETVHEELLSTSKKTMTWPQLLQRACGSTGNFTEDLSTFLAKSITEARRETHATAAWKALTQVVVSSDVSAAVPMPIEHEIKVIMANLARLGLLDSKSICPKTPSGTAIDSLCTTLQDQMGYRSHERDFIFMIHRFRVHYPATGERKQIKATLSIRGHDLVNSATALTVGVPVGAVAQLILDGGLKDKVGLLSPTDPKLYEPILSTLEEEGIKMHEEVRSE